MRFLCVPCDQPMKLAATKPPDRGSLTVVYACPSCGYEMAMLTNPHETQLVTSLGVRIGPQGAGGAHAGEPAASGPGCPFAAMVQGVPEREADSPPPDAVRWTPGAVARLAAIPSFVRPMARAGVERFAAERGISEVTESVLDEARSYFGM